MNELVVRLMARATLAITSLALPRILKTLCGTALRLSFNLSFLVI